MQGDLLEPHEVWCSTAPPENPKKKAPSVGSGGRGGPRCRVWSGALQVAALLVLLAGSAVAGVVPPDLGTRGGPASRPGAPARLGGDRTSPTDGGAVRAGLLGSGPARQRHLWRGFRHHLHLEEPLHHRGLHPRGHVLEQIEGLLLVLHQGIALAVAAQPDTLLEVIDGEQVV